MKLNWNFLGGRWCKTKNLPWGSMDIFWNCTLNGRGSEWSFKNTLYVSQYFIQFHGSRCQVISESQLLRETNASLTILLSLEFNIISV